MASENDKQFDDDLMLQRALQMSLEQVSVQSSKDCSDSYFDIMYFLLVFIAAIDTGCCGYRRKDCARSYRGTTD